MKYYLFLTNEVGNVGGGQLYIAHKSSFLQECGYKPLVCFFLDTEIKIDAFREYAGNFIREMQMPYGSCTSRIRTQAAEKILEILKRNGIKKGDEVIFESYNNLTSLWGEWFSVYLQRRGYKGRHLFYNIVEHPRFVTGAQKELTLVKFGKGQLKCVKPTLLQKALPEVDCGDTELTPGESSSRNVVDVECPGMNYERRGNFTILSLSRLDKPYIPYAMAAVAEFCRKHPDEEFDLIVVGDTSDKSVMRNAVKDIEKCRNIRLINLGYLFPIPKEVMRVSDVMLGVAGSVRLCYSEGVPSISIDSNDFKAIGIFGEDTETIIARKEDEKPQEITGLLEKIYSERDKRKAAREQEEKDPERKRVLDVDYAKHLKWLDDSEDSNWEEIENVGADGVKERLFNLAMRLRGEGLIYFLKHLKQTLK